MRKLLIVLVLALTACGSAGVHATRLAQDRPLGDEGGRLAVPAASQRATVTAKAALAACREDGSCLKSTPVIELADVTTSNGELRNRLAYVLTFRHIPCSSAGPVASSPATLCTYVSVVDAGSGGVAYQFDHSE